MAARIRTLNFLPEIFQTPTNAQFLGATLDQIVDQPNTMQIEGYIGSRFGYGINAKDNYVVEPTKARIDYQLDPGIVFTKTNTSTAKDFISYPGIIDALKLEGAITNNNDRLFNSEFYSWDSFTNLDKIINFNQYYWLPTGAPVVNISTDIVYTAADYTVESLPNGYNISSDVNPDGATNPTLTLIRGGTYTFTVNQSSEFWIQGKPGVTGYDPQQPNIQTRDVLGVENNGARVGIVSFTVPYKNAQDDYNFPGNNLVDVVSTIQYDLINGQLLSTVKNIDGVTSLNGLTVMFYNTGVVSESGYISKFYDSTLYDEDGGLPGYTPPGSTLDFNNFEGGYYTDVSATFYTITYEGSVSDPVLRLVYAGSIPTNQKITANYGTAWKAKDFYRNNFGSINLIPYQSAVLDTLYYQDGTSANKVGIIRLIESNSTNQLDITSILGKEQYTSPNGVVFTNGLKVSFSGDIFPTRYKDGEYYVEGVGTAIELLDTSTLIAPEPFTTGTYTPYDSLPYDIGNFDSTLYIPLYQDYITISRNSIDKNAWSRSNRWFHVDVINATASYNNDPTIATLYATQNNKAKRPIIEFYPNLRLFDNGVIGKAPIDFFDDRTTDAFSYVAGQENYWPDVEVYTAYTAQIAGTTGTSTTITVDADDITGAFQIGQYISDTTNILPRNTTITNISGTTTITLTVEWNDSTTIVSTTTSSLVANDVSNDNYALYDGARIVFSADTNLNVKDKIYVVRFSDIMGTETPIITLTEAVDGLVLPLECTFAFKGYNNQGKNFYFEGITWLIAQQKTTVNQAPYFDVFDNDGISFGNTDVYVGTSFSGNKLFSYGIGSGIKDIILGFPLRYSSVNNVGDISFDVPLNSATFNYVQGSAPITQKVNTGYVYNYTSRTNVIRQLGWQTAVAESRQYQIFSFNYIASEATTTYTCDIAAAIATVWPNIQVYVNNVLQETSAYTFTITENSTIVNFTVPNPLVDTVVEITLLSDQVSPTAYYQIPINLQNNPFNDDVTVVNVGDIRGQYQSIFYNNPNTTGVIFGSNNYRDLGNLVPWGTKIIQNSASLALPGSLLRAPNYNLFNSLQYNSQQYINFKSLLVYTIDKTEYNIRQTPATILDDALDQITANKTNSEPFFWSDMLPNKSAYATNTYTFANSLDVSIYPLTRVYNFDTANYYGLLVYLTTTIDNYTSTIQLVINQDYTVSIDSPSLTITKDLLPGDIVTIREYNQTFGSFVPNTPTKLGLYPSFIPGVTLDSDYSQPTYFILGHDGSYTKLYGDYIDGHLVDFRDQALLEFETRVYNNLKLSDLIPVSKYDVIPGFFRTTDYSYDEVLQIYSQYFLNWVGQNRIEYKKQFYQSTDQYSYNYNQSGNKINGQAFEQGFWRGIYEYFYDTSTPNITPWEMIGFTDKPSWWDTRYGAAPYTSDNLILWGDLAAGINWNNGDPIVLPEFVREELLQVIPVDSAGNLLSPFDAVMGNYSQRTFRNDWVVGDVGPAEFSYRRSSSWPFDLMKILALTKPAQFFNLGFDVDNYKYSTEFNQYLVNNRSHLIISDVAIYGTGTAKTSYVNWIVDYEKQVGVNATQNITDLFDNLDVRLIYRLAGFSDKSLLGFYVEKGTPNSRNASLLIPDESYSILLYDNIPTTTIIYSGVIVQSTETGWKVFGNSQDTAYFTTVTPKINGNYNKITVGNLSVQIANDYTETKTNIIPYGTEFVDIQSLSQFIASYGTFLLGQGVLFDQIESGIDVNWRQMITELLYWSQSGWEIGSLVNLNPAANLITINKDSHVVQPLTLQKQNFVLNQNFYPIQSVDLSINRDSTFFSAKPLNEGDTVAYGQFNISNFEHGIVFDNVTVFNDVLYNLITGLRQNRILTRGVKSAEWNGTVDAQGFILNQDNIEEWSSNSKYTRGSIVKYKNRYWFALKVLNAKEIFEEQDWKVTDYDEIQKGLLPNSSARSYESTLYYDTNKGNLDQDSDLLSWSLIGYRPRDYLALADLTDITQVNVYKNLIKEKGTRIAANNFKGLSLPQGGIDYDIYDNWAIKTGEFGGVLNNNFVDFRLNQNLLTSNPSIVGLTNGVYTDGVQQEVPVHSIFNYGRPINSPNVLPTLPANTPNRLFPDAGYVNFNDVKISAYYYNGLNTAVTPLSNLYVNEYVWLADYLSTWQVYTPISIGQVIGAINNMNGTVTIQFASPHNLTKYQPFAIINFNSSINGYRIVSSVVDNFRVTILLSLNPSTTTILGQGVAFKFSSQRVATPKDINTLPLLDSEFVKNKVWVDENDDGSWAVYRKSLNYVYGDELFKTGSTSYGSAVARTPNLGYLVTDAGAGSAYRYSYSPVFDTYSIVQTITNNTSFGSTITYSDNLFVISQPTGVSYSDRKVYIYELVITTLVNELQAYQVITAPNTVTNWGSSITISGDQNWLYISAYEQNLVYAYRKSNITVPATIITAGNTYVIQTLGNTNWNTVAGTTGESYAVGDTLIAVSVGTGTGYATDVTYMQSGTITVSGLSVGDSFGYAIATNYYGNNIAISAPYQNNGVDDLGYAYSFERLVQTFEAPYNSLPYIPQTFGLIYQPATQSKTASSILSNAITLNSVTSLEINMPVIFTGVVYGNVSLNQVYYINSIVGSTVTLSLTRGGSIVTLVNASGTMTLVAQIEPIFVSVNGTLIDDNEYGVSNSSINIYNSLTAGDIITVSGSEFILTQEFTSLDSNPEVGTNFGYSLDVDTYANELLIGAPFEINSKNQEGAVYRYTYGGGSYGIITGTTECNVLSQVTILINGYAVTIPVGSAPTVANAIASANITNVTASVETVTAGNFIVGNTYIILSAGTTNFVQIGATSNTVGTVFVAAGAGIGTGTAYANFLTIQVISVDLAYINAKLTVSVLDKEILDQLGIQIYTQTQLINDPHSQGRTEFGHTIKFNSAGSFVVSAPVSSRYSETTFDASDDENYNNDTLFDNNTTQFIDSFVNAGAVYMYDYLPVYNETATNPGAYVYAQSVNALNVDYGGQPYYGTALEFTNNSVMIGTPNFRPGYDNGQVVIYNNDSGETDWAVYRNSAPIVNTDAIQNVQLYSISTNNTLNNLDYIDPLQGKILGAVRQNLDIISNTDPANYNSPDATNKGSAVWGPGELGKLWFDTSTTKFVNYHQSNDVVYNSVWWGRVFPGSDIKVYSWITSDVLPIAYQGPGTPNSFDNYVVQYSLNSTGSIVPVYYYWVRNTNIVFNKIGKTLSDTICESYIATPLATGISYMAPIQSNVFGLYNCTSDINATDTALHIGFASGTNDDVSHSVYSLIRSKYADDFLPGLPGIGDTLVPESLYNKMLESLSGVDQTGGVVPDPYLPKPVQSGILVRPRQSFFYNRFKALENYLKFYNEVLSQYPLTETSSLKFLFTRGEINPSTVGNPNWPGQPLFFYNTQDYWEVINWWAPGYDNNTRASLLVESYYDLAPINAQLGLIVTVNKNGDGLQETYVYDGAIWNRIGLQNGTIQFSSALWDYADARLGFGDNFFDTTPYDTFPSEETRYIIRSLNEELPSSLLLYRNEALILLFEYIVSETIESQNYLPWLNKTSFIDVAHTIRELLPLEVYQSDNQEFLSGYLNEVKPYHVVIKDFLFKYTGSDNYLGNITDFDLPAEYSTQYEQYITPELVYSNPSGINQYLPTDPIWQTKPYVNWFNNQGLSITGIADYPITILSSYLSLNSSAMVVDNVYGFPTTGVILIGTEQIAYSIVDRAYSTLSGLTRGVNDTPITNHIPGEQIIIDLPPILLLNGGRGYAEPPKVTAYIDTTIYPAPRRVAILEPVMNLDTILRIDVIDPGEGYQVLPEIIIDPSEVVTFASTVVDLSSRTITLQTQFVQTGDLIKYYVGTDTTPIGGLDNNQYYYLAVLESTPFYVIALYTTYSDALQDHDRVIFTDIGSGNNNKIAVSARASCVSTSAPIRENNIKLKFDRTTYTSGVTQWAPDNFYGSFYAGLFNNSIRIASSSITLESTQPPIDNILASAQGATFEIQDVTNDQVLAWSSLIRAVSETVHSGATNLVRLAYSSTEPNASGSTIGFYVGMPIKFTGAVGPVIINETIYYVAEIINESDFSISTTDGGSVLILTNYTVTAAGMSCYIGEITNTAIVTIAYPGILNVTATENTSNFITSPLLPTSTGGTTGFYVGLPVYFVGNVFGGIIDNVTYYIITIVDDETFTISTENDPLALEVTGTTTTGEVTVSSTLQLAVNDPILFTGSDLGELILGQVYYIRSIESGTSITIADVLNGSAVSYLYTEAVDCTLTSQTTALQLTTASGSMTMNVGLPVSPGQVNGQQFTFYPTIASVGTTVSGVNTTVLTRDTVAATDNGNYLYLSYLSGGLSNIYNNLPFKVTSSIGGLSTSTLYYVLSNETLTVEVASSSSSTNTYTLSSGTLTTGFYVDMPISFSGLVYGNPVALATYYINSYVTDGDQFTITDRLGGVLATEIESGKTYTIYSLGTTDFTTLGASSNTKGLSFVASRDGTLLDGTGRASAQFILTTFNGTMTLTANNPYVTVSTSSGGSEVTLTTEIKETTFVQNPTAVPTFNVGTKLGGYTIEISQTNAGSFVIGNTYTIASVGDTNFTLIGAASNTVGVVFIATGVGSGTGVAASAGSGYTFDNIITIPGTALTFNGVAGSSPLNDLVLTISNIDVITSTPFASNGTITDVIGSGTSGGDVNQYYLKVITATECEVYSDALMTVPVNGMTLETEYQLGDYVFLPEPFYFNQSIVKYNNKVWQCIISNNDSEFILGKWELMDSGDRKLNELDRIVGYYQPTVNMPGLDLTQLVSGIIYPNGTYLGNAFAPEDEYTLDTELQDKSFNLIADTIYNVQGDPFLSGYGPEELVPGLISDNLSMIVTTRPGTDWDASIYGHVGFNVVSTEIMPNTNQTEFSFNRIVENPANMSLFDIDYSNNLSTRIYNFTVDWVNKIVTLAAPLASTRGLRLDLYEVGNGDQLVKSNSQVIPFVDNIVTGFVEMPLNCNYSASRFNGSGVIRPTTDPKQVIAIETDALDNGITCDNVDYFSVNSPITFQGDVFGGIETDTTYYVKTLSHITNKITVSTTIISGIAGPTFDVTSDIGSMLVNIQSTNGLVWTDPIIIHNGTNLVLGEQGIVSETKSGTNTIVVNSTDHYDVGDTIIFSNAIDSGSFVGCGLTEQTTYYITSITGNEFTVSTTLGGSDLVLNDATGIALCVTNDYAITLADQGITAKLVFSSQYNQNDDFVVLSIFGETAPIQYGYTVPETQIFTLTNTSTEFALRNFVGQDNSENAIVEYNGLRLTNNADYTINSATDTLNLTFTPSVGSIVSVTTYNLTDRQYLNTTYSGLSTTVANIISINNDIVNTIASTNISNTTAPNTITGGLTTGFQVGQSIMFKDPTATGFGNVLANGKVYYISYVDPNGTDFEVSDTINLATNVPGSSITVTTASGSMVAYVGGNESIVVTTGIPHNLAEDDLVRINSVLGSTELNNNTYYAKVINPTQVGLYYTPYNPTLSYVNSPVTQVSSYYGNGYIWLNNLFTLETTNASATSASTNIITVASTNKLIPGTPLVFTGTTLGGIQSLVTAGSFILGNTYQIIETGTTLWTSIGSLNNDPGTTFVATGVGSGTGNATAIYYVHEINGAYEFSVTAIRDGEVYSLTNDTGLMNVTQWEQTNVDRLWVTVNGYRIPSSGLYLNPQNNLSILTVIQPGDIVIITNMIPTATPNETVYIENVNKSNQQSVFRSNSLTRTWLTYGLQDVDDVIYVEDVSRVTESIIQDDIAPAVVDNTMSIGLYGDKSAISQVIVYNNTTSSIVDPADYTIVVENVAPVLLIDINPIIPAIVPGDDLTITVILGNLIYINGEQIRYTTVNFVENTLSGLQRGANGTGKLTYIPKYTTVYSVLPSNLLPELYNGFSWNSFNYNLVDGDPLQISTTYPANFLNADVP